MLQEGDANTSYFHSLVKGKRSQLSIPQLRDSQGALLTQHADLVRAAVDFYTDLFAPSSDQQSR